MNKRSLRLFVFAFFTAGCLLPPAARAQAVQSLTLAQAEAIAIRNHPRLLASLDRAQAAGKVTSEVRSVYLPQVYGAASGADAENGSRISAGALNNPIIYDRYANGLEVSQLITDFGRTRNLVKSADDSAKAQAQTAAATREDVLLQVDDAYFGALRAQAVLRVAQETVQERQLVVSQVSLLEQNKLKSALDVSFAKVNLEQAKLFQVSAQNDVQAAYADLSLALGYNDQRTYSLQEQPMPPAPRTDLAALVAEALRNRPEIASGRYQLASAQTYERAARDLWFPTLSAVGATGLAPVHADQLMDRYAAAGFNLSIPIFNGGLFNAQRAEANFQADAAAQELREEEDQVAHDVRVAWLSLTTAYQRLSLTQQLEQEAKLALQLSQARYTLGLSSIVELSQAQLNETQAEIDYASAKYQFQIAHQTLQYQLGALP
jgi:outer membrane protein